MPLSARRFPSCGGWLVDVLALFATLQLHLVVAAPTPAEFSQTLLISRKHDKKALPFPSHTYAGMHWMQRMTRPSACPTSTAPRWIWSWPYSAICRATGHFPKAALQQATLSVCCMSEGFQGVLNVIAIGWRILLSFCWRLLAILNVAI